MKRDTQFSIFLVNQAGILSQVTMALAEAGVNLYALSLNDSGEHGALRIITSDADKTRAVLQETHDRWTETEVVLIPIGNEPGAFGHLCQYLASEGVNITYAYCTSEKDAAQTVAVVKFLDTDLAIDVINKRK